jgi:hypothetical protein
LLALIREEIPYTTPPSTAATIDRMSACGGYCGG